jgi:Fe-S-cluster containining protein
MWACQRDGACCTQPGEVVMSRAEQVAIERAAPSGVSLRFLPHSDARFVRLVAGPCPLYDTAGGCSVYDVRPYNCRRFACQRTDYTQPFDQGPQTREDRRQLIRIQRKAQRWARAHGWVDA